MRGHGDRGIRARNAPARGGPVSAESSECHAEKMRIQTALQYPNALHLSFPLQQQPLAWQGKRKAGFLPPNFSPGGQKCEKYAPLWRYFFPRGEPVPRRASARGGLSQSDRGDADCRQNFPRPGRVLAVPSGRAPAARESRVRREKRGCAEARPSLHFIPPLRTLCG